MTIEIPTIEPNIFTAGYSLQWKKTLPDFLPSDNWVLKYYFVHIGNQIVITAVDDNDDHLVDVAPNTTANYIPGIYDYQSEVENSVSSARYPIGTGKLQILPDFSTQTEGYDNRSFAKIMIDTLESLIPELLAGKMVSYNIAGRSAQFHNVAECRKELTYWRAVFAQEERAAGRRKSNYILPKMR